ncbi:unnamed protein product [Linum trigynum]|uniref:Uncharacterized protein n=1 Tax=Linum trigynum TaxID=586398 RepID=A0AAV2E000_9ROSI
MELKIKSRKLPEAIGVIDRLIQVEPNNDECLLLKDQIYSYSDDSDPTTKIFEEVLEKDPLRWRLITAWSWRIQKMGGP